MPFGVLYGYGAEGLEAGLLESLSPSSSVGWIGGGASQMPDLVILQFGGAAWCHVELVVGNKGGDDLALGIEKLATVVGAIDKTPSAEFDLPDAGPYGAVGCVARRPEESIFTEDDAFVQRDGHRHRRPRKDKTGTLGEELGEK